MSNESPPARAPKGAELFALFTDIAIIEHLARNRLERALPDGLRMSHFGVLNHMVRLGDGETPIQLARAFQVVKAAMTNTLQRLETRGLVILKPDERDGRSKRVLITPEGRRVRDEAIVIALKIMSELADGELQKRLSAAAPAISDLRVVLDTNRS